MSVDLTFAKNKLAKLEILAQNLSEASNLFDKEHLSNLLYSINSLKKRIQQHESDDKMLRIGIIGDVKAGKSSFLNAFIFDGLDFLPKAATPMTAALTRISYSESPQSEAVIHFYPPEDWQKIKTQASEYDKKMDKAYSEYYENEMNSAQAAQMAEPYFGMGSDISILSKEEFEQKYRKKFGEELAAAKELTMMSLKEDAEKKLGTCLSVSIDAKELSASLSDYIGARGAYTPIVSYVELKIHDEHLKGIEIIDTPGLNDPVVSRGLVTRQFLGECNVALLLSRCSQFMDESTVNLMLRRLPSSNIPVIQVIGSQIDMGMLDYKGGRGKNKINFADAYTKTQKSCQTGFAQTLESERKKLPPSAALESLSKNSPIFSSSMLYTLAVKRKKQQSLSKDEQVALDNMLGLPGFKEEFLEGLSGYQKIHEFFEKIRDERAELLEQDSKEFVKQCCASIKINIEQISTDAITNKKILETQDIDELRQRHAALQNILDSSRKHITNIFQYTALEAEKNALAAKSDIVILQKEYREIKIETKTEEHEETIDAGFLGLRKDHYTRHITTKSASSGEVIANIGDYKAACLAKIREHFGAGLVDEEYLRNELKKVMQNAMGQNEKIKPEEILYPVNVVLKAIQISRGVDISDAPYIDEINSHFPTGVAFENEIHELSSLQQTLFSRMAEVVQEKIDYEVKKICETMNEYAATFADDVEKKLSGNFSELEKQLEEKDLYLEKYTNFIAQTKQYKEML